MALSPETRDKLRRVSTATLATALFKRGFRSQMIQGPLPLHTPAESMVGEAFTVATSRRGGPQHAEALRDRTIPAQGDRDLPPGHVLVFDSRKDARAASAGAILVGRLKARGVAGVVTDGGFRDSAEIAALGIPAFHTRPSAPTNLTLNHAIDINVPIACGDAPVFPGDVLVGDCDGVIVIPAHLADDIAAEATEMTAYEDFVTEKVAEGRTIVGLYPATNAANLDEFKVWRAAKGR